MVKPKQHKYFTPAEMGDRISAKTAAILVPILHFFGVEFDASADYNPEFLLRFQSTFAPVPDDSAAFSINNPKVLALINLSGKNYAAEFGAAFKQLYADLGALNAQQVPELLQIIEPWLASKVRLFRTLGAIAALNLAKHSAHLATQYCKRFAGDCCEIIRLEVFQIIEELQLNDPELVLCLANNLNDPIAEIRGLTLSLFIRVQHVQVNPQLLVQITNLTMGDELLNRIKCVKLIEKLINEKSADDSIINALLISCFDYNRQFALFSTAVVLRSLPGITNFAQLVKQYVSYTGQTPATELYQYVGGLYFQATFILTSNIDVDLIVSNENELNIIVGFLLAAVQAQENKKVFERLSFSLIDSKHWFGKLTQTNFNTVFKSITVNYQQKLTSLLPVIRRYNSQILFDLLVKIFTVLQSENNDISLMQELSNIFQFDFVGLISDDAASLELHQKLQLFNPKSVDAPQILQLLQKILPTTDDAQNLFQNLDSNTVAADNNVLKVYFYCLLKLKEAGLQNYQVIDSYFQLQKQFDQHQMNLLRELISADQLEESCSAMFQNLSQSLLSLLEAFPKSLQNGDFLRTISDELFIVIQGLYAIKYHFYSKHDLSDDPDAYIGVIEGIGSVFEEISNSLSSLNEIYQTANQSVVFHHFADLQIVLMVFEFPIFKAQLSSLLTEHNDVFTQIIKIYQLIGDFTPAVGFSGDLCQNKGDMLNDLITSVKSAFKQRRRSSTGGQDREMIKVIVWLRRKDPAIAQQFKDILGSEGWSLVQRYSGGEEAIDQE